MSRLIQPHGLLPVYKPPGMISKDVSRQIERRFGRLKLGHVGTLDPMAEGVLPLLLGSATRLQDHLLEARKSYRFTMDLGYETDTLDAEGTIVKETPVPPLSVDRVLQALALFRGPSLQTPPIYSAIKYRGRPLYDYARKDQIDQVPLQEMARSIEVYRFDLISFDQSQLTAQVEVSKGTYIRCIIRDLSAALGTCATLTALGRTKASGLSDQQCLPLGEILEFNQEEFLGAVIPIEKMVLPIPKCSLAQATVTRLQTGQKVWLDEAAFDKSLQESDGNWHCGLGSSPILLTDPTGRAFGLGFAERSAAGKIWLNMKRGF